MSKSAYSDFRYEVPSRLLDYHGKQCIECQSLHVHEAVCLAMCVLEPSCLLEKPLDLMLFTKPTTHALEDFRLPRSLTSS